MKIKKTFLFFCFTFALAVASIAQQWDSLGRQLGYPPEYINVSSLCVYQADMVVGGEYTISKDSTGETGLIGWNGNSWDTLTEAGGHAPSALLAYNGDLVALGFDVFNGFCIAQWNNTVWDTLGGAYFVWGQWAYPYQLCEYRGDLYMSSGFFSPTLGYFDYRWNGSYWDSIPNAYNYRLVDAAMAVYGNKLYFGAYDVVAWNDTILSPILDNVNGYIKVLYVWNGKLYAGGHFDNIGGIVAHNIACWDGAKWDSVGAGVSNDVYVMAAYHNCLVVGGIFDSAGNKPCNKIAKWDGTQWTTMGSGVAHRGLQIKGNGATVNSLCTYKGTLYIGGLFDSAGGVYSEGIARWEEPTDTTTSYYGPLVVYPNPSPGIFTFKVPVNITLPNATLRIYDVMGRAIFSTSFSEPFYQVNLSNESKGIYFYRVTSSSGKLIGTGKLAVE